MWGFPGRVSRGERTGRGRGAQAVEGSPRLPVISAFVRASEPWGLSRTPAVWKERSWRDWKAERATFLIHLFPVLCLRPCLFHRITASLLLGGGCTHFPNVSQSLSPRGAGEMQVSPRTGRERSCKGFWGNKMSAGLFTAYAPLLHVFKSFRNITHSSLSSPVRSIN